MSRGGGRLALRATGCLRGSVRSLRARTRLRRPSGPLARPSVEALADSRDDAVQAERSAPRPGGWRAPRSGGAAPAARSAGARPRKTPEGAPPGPTLGVLLPLALAAGCARSTSDLGSFQLTLDRDAGTFTLAHASGRPVLEQVRLAAGAGSADATMQVGSFLFENETLDLTWADGFGGLRAETGLALLEVKAGGDVLGNLVMTAPYVDVLALEWASADPTANRLALSAACDAAGVEHFWGLGSHAQDVDHVGEAFPLWVSEPGIGKTSDDFPPADWFVTGTRHASSYPMPVLHRPQRTAALVAETTARVDVDLCATDAGAFEVVVWEPASTRFVVTAPATNLEVSRNLALLQGSWTMPPAWVFGPWNDAIRGQERVREVAAVLRAADAPTSVIWTEDWKGAEENATGYHLSGEWSVDTELYGEAAQVAAELDVLGIRWLAYFSPFIISPSDAFDEALADGVTLQTSDGEPYLFTGATFTDTTMLDFTADEPVLWAWDRMQAALDLGFDGWMADFAEWLPVDVDLAAGDPWLVHNDYPRLWQATQRELLAGLDATWFVRSGWWGTARLSPVVWAGDQRTSFDADDGLPTVVPLGLGLAVGGVPVYGHDVAGYSGLGNGPSTKELWFRWAALATFSPVMRTHHGAYDSANWQFDSDQDTLAYWAGLSRVRAALHPYLTSLAAEAANLGSPMIRPLAMHHAADVDRIDAWMLGDALLVAPVVEEGVAGREVDLPEGRWWDWWALTPAEGGFYDAPLDLTRPIPVFLADRSTVPLFDVLPDTFVDLPDATQGDLVDLPQADRSRRVLLVGGGGERTEADGTVYRPSGTPTAAGEVTSTLTAGSVEVAGVVVEVEGPVERTYTFVVLP